METIYHLRIFIIIAIWVIASFLLGWNPQRVKGWRQYAIVLVSAMLIFVIMHW